MNDLFICPGMLPGANNGYAFLDNKDTDGVRSGHDAAHVFVRWLYLRSIGRATIVLSGHVLSATD